MTKYFDFDLKENYGIQICTSGTRPTAYEGRHIYETDTNKTLVCTNVTGPVWEEISGGGVTDHGALTGLTDDDHTQYLLTDGTRTVTGTLHLGAQDAVNEGGEINFAGAGSNASFFIDNYTGSFRLVNDTPAVIFDIQQNGIMTMYNNIVMSDKDIIGANAVQATASQDLTLKVSTGQSIIFQAV